MVNCELGRLRDNLQYSIQTILDQLTDYIPMYSQKDQIHLNEFIRVLHHYKEADYDRKNLAQRYQDFRHEVLNAEQYLRLPFYWFVGTFLKNAHLLLNVSKFHANPFYEYIIHILRGNSQKNGVFQMIRHIKPLSDLVWEELQQESDKFLVPLTSTQFEILKAVYSCISDEGIYALDPQKLKISIQHQVRFPRKTKPLPEIKRLFSLLEGQWFIRFSSLAFGLERLFFHFQLEESISLKEIFDFQNPNNTVLCMSDVFEVRRSPRTYLGIFYIPTHELNDFKNFVLAKDEEGFLILNDLQRINTKWSSISLNRYQPKTGWSELSPTEMQQIALSLKSKKPRKRSKNRLSLYIPPPFNLNWYYHQHPLPQNIIRFFSNNPNIGYSFSNLPLGVTNDRKKKILSTTEIGLLKQLYYNQVIHIGFVPWRLVYEDSIDFYSINLPKIRDYQLERFLNIPLYSEIHETDKNIKIWVRLPPKLIQWIEDELNWEIFPLLLHHFPFDPDIHWFDSERLRWKTPEFLKKKAR